ncbi:hypothetical protein SESBI_35440 [Sesbania bispinosa]|nr:hypothetical protein SESBI_35440 [Sesbania bispinosa]
MIKRRIKSPKPPAVVQPATTTMLKFPSKTSLLDSAIPHPRNSAFVHPPHRGGSSPTRECTWNQ